MEIKNRRDFLKLGGFLGIGTIATLAPSADMKMLDVNKAEDWQEIPTFQNGQLLDADHLQALSIAILQLQKKVGKL